MLETLFHDPKVVEKRSCLVKTLHEILEPRKHPLECFSVKPNVFSAGVVVHHRVGPGRCGLFHQREVDWLLL